MKPDILVRTAVVTSAVCPRYGPYPSLLRGIKPNPSSSSSMLCDVRLESTRTDGKKDSRND